MWTEMNSNGTPDLTDANSMAKTIETNLVTLLQEYHEGVRLTDLEDLYTKRFGQTLIYHLLVLNPRICSNRFLFTQRAIENTDSMENMIGLKPDPMPDITQSGPTPRDYRFTPFPVLGADAEDVLAYVSYIDQHSEYLFLQIEENMRHLEELNEELDLYYSDPISDQWIVTNVERDLACVTKYQDIHHRAVVEEIYQSQCVVRYIDIGVKEVIQYEQTQLKYLLNYFANTPTLATPCRLANINFKKTNNQIPQSTYEELYALCQGVLFSVKFHSQVSEVWHVEIFDNGQTCLNAILVAKGLAFDQTGHYSKQASAPAHDQKGKKTPSVPKANESALMDDYEVEDRTPVIPTSAIHVKINKSDAYDDYDQDELSQITRTKQQKKNNTSTNESRQLNQPDHGNRPAKNRRQDNFHGGNLRIFVLAMSDLNTNGIRHQRMVTDLSIPHPAKPTDTYIEWMGSVLGMGSLWNNVDYRDALLTYLGRIYGQKPHMHRVFMQVTKKYGDLDELDILHQLIQGTRQLPGAERFLQKWQDSSRIDRRLKDIEFIFTYGSDAAPRNSPFTVTSFGPGPIIQRRTGEYFDLGCGNGVITAGIGQGLGLTTQNIFGGDVFDAKNESITFVPLDERQSTIQLETNRVDLITAFVTLHHVPDVRTTLKELQRIIRPGGYLILREHDSEAAYALTPKYLHFIHAIMMIARVGEFANIPETENGYSDGDWEQQKSRIIEYTKSIHYRTRDEWDKEFQFAGFHPVAYLDYGNDGGGNPQKLFYAVYQQGQKNSY